MERRADADHHSKATEVKLNALTKIEPEHSLQSNILDVISRAAKDPSVDVEKMERLMAMQERVLARQAEMAFHTSMQAAQRAMPTVPKDGANPQTNSKFSKLETLYKKCVPVITDHGFSVSFGTADCPLPGHFRVVARVSHTAGHSERYQADVPSDHLGPKGLPNKTLTHGFGSSMSYARRYLMMLIFNVNTGDDNDGNGSGDKGSNVTALVKRLWEMLAPVRGKQNNWNEARKWLDDQRLLVLSDSRKVSELSADELTDLIARVEIVLEEGQ